MAWLVTLFTGLTVAGLAWWLWQRRVRWRARRRLRRMARQYQRDPRPEVLFPALSALMRQTAQDLSRHYPVAGLSGHRWLVFLDETGNTQDFTRGPGRVLIDAPYQNAHTLAGRAIDVPAVLDVCQNWLRHARFNAEHHR